MKRKDKAKAESINDKATHYHQKIVNYLESHELKELCYTRKSRVKSKNDILSKVDRKNEEDRKTKYKIDHITDIVGLRFIVLFKKDLIPVTQKIVDLLCNDKSEKNPFLESEVEEIIYYKGNVSISNISRKIQESFSCIDKEVKESISNEGYSSIHIVCKLKTDNHDVLPNKYRIPVEIQVRTIFEDAWGEIDHKYGYKARRESSSSHPTLDKHLKTLKHFVDACVDYADLIVEESEIEINHSDFSRVLNIPENPKDLSKLFSHLDIKEDYIDEYKKAIKLKNKSIDDGNSKSLIDCADTFLNIKSRYIKNKGSSYDDEFTFYCSLNYGFCCLVDNTERGIKQAKDIYLDLISLDPKNSLVLMRLGQTMGKIKESDKSISYLKSSYEHALKKDSNFKIKKTDINYILSKVPKTVGYYIWLKIHDSSETLTEESIQSLYQDAYDFTLKGFQALDSHKYPADYIEYQNNLTYYLTEIYKIDANSNLKDQITEKLSEIKDYYGSPENIDAATLDTLVNAYAVLEDKDNFVLYADFLKKKIFVKDYNFDDGEALEMLMLIDKANSLLTDE
ncbi:RelA/SpoT domain-containing protein [Psychrobacter celer]|uniref:RelA/SpoT domain-containing protein n=1 Tax=Psychrobacter celer TaxID=306572 RepID=UPI002FE4CB18